MRAWVINRIGTLSPDTPPLDLVNLPDPEPGVGEVRLRVDICGVCHTELDEIEGRTPPNTLPRVPGHQVIGTVDKHGPGAVKYPLGTRVGIAWIYSACGGCRLCQSGMENLCAEFRGTGRDADGGYAEYMIVNEAFSVPIPDEISTPQAAPLLCAGAVGYRSLRLANLTGSSTLGLTGFGASAHLVLQMARHLYPDIRIAVFARSETQRAFAMELGATWSGAIEDRPPFALSAIIDTTPAWRPVVSALSCLEPGGRLVLNAIRKEDSDKLVMNELDYGGHLWMEKEIKSVANVTRADVEACLSLAVDAGIKPETQVYPFEDANKALLDLKAGRSRGAKVLTVS